MTARTISGVVILVTFVVWIIWDIFAFYYGEGVSTLSVVITDWSFYSPGIPFLFGGLCGHWFFPARRSGL